MKQEITIPVPGKDAVLQEISTPDYSGAPMDVRRDLG